MTSDETGAAVEQPGQYADNPGGWIAECLAYNRVYLYMLDNRAQVDSRIRDQEDQLEKAGKVASRLRHYIQAGRVLENEVADLLFSAIEKNIVRNNAEGVEIDQVQALRDFLDALENPPQRESRRGKGRSTYENDLAVFLYNNAFGPRGLSPEEAIPHLAAHFHHSAASQSTKNATAKRIREHFRYSGIISAD